MTPIECLNKTNTVILNMNIPKNFKSELLDDLKYFIHQANLPIASRDHQSLIQSRWMAHIKKTKGVGIYETLMRDDILWRTLQCFCFMEEPSSFILPKIDKASLPIEKFSGMDAETFFKYMCDETKKCKSVLGPRFLEVYFALKFLQSEARHSRGRRSVNEIEKVALWLKPILSGLKLLKEFEKEKAAQEKINFFINDGLQIRVNFFEA